MVPQPEQVADVHGSTNAAEGRKPGAAREAIDKLLTQAGWAVFDADQTNIHAARGVAIRKFPLKSGHGFADYLVYVDGKAAGVIEAKEEGATLTGVETQSAKYTQGLPAWCEPLPFSYQSTGSETRFPNGLDPQPRSRLVFAVHKPETLADLLHRIATPVGAPPPARPLESTAPRARQTETRSKSGRSSKPNLPTPSRKGRPSKQRPD